MEPAQLSPRELEILTWAAKGKTYSETALILDVSFATIHTHITNLKLKMNAANIAHAVAGLRDWNSRAQHGRAQTNHRGGHAVADAHPLT
jgi:DNA-binding CsgD family transcriptional regulator